MVARRVEWSSVAYPRLKGLRVGTEHGQGQPWEGQGGAPRWSYQPRHRHHWYHRHHHVHYHRHRHFHYHRLHHLHHHHHHHRYYYQHQHIGRDRRRHLRGSGSRRREEQPGRAA